MHFDLEKDTAKVRFMLDKRNILNIVSEVICVLDVSGSTEDMYMGGDMQSAVQRIVPVALNFDDNGELPVYTFCDKSYTIEDPMTAKNYQTFIKHEIIDGNIPKWGGTSYEPVLHDVLSDLGFYRNVETTVPRGGFFKFLGDNKVVTSSKLQKHSSSKMPAIIYILTDGENGDKESTTLLLSRCADVGVEAYFNFIGIGNTRFNYLEKIGDQFPNVGFAQIKDIVKTGGSDDIYEYLLPTELTDWLKAFVGKSA